MKITNLLFILLLFLSSCNVGQEYEVPWAPVPEQWKTAQEGEILSPIVDNWWEIFDDPILNQLEMTAVENNSDIHIAIARVFEERALAGIREADLYPQLDLNGRYVTTGALIRVFGLPPPLPQIIRVHELLYSMTLHLKYELDLWGKFKNQYNSALYSVEAKQQGLEATWLSITTDLASHYFELRSYDAQIDLLKKTMETRQQAVEINQKLYKGSFINASDVTRAELLFYNAESELTSLLRKRANKENMIAVLIGIAASDFCIEHNPIMDPPPPIPAGIPSVILLNRPDIAEAERMAASEQALTRSTYASFFPSLSLTTEEGFSSPDLRDFLKWKSRFWSFGADTTESLFDGGRKLANYQLANARFARASATYRQKVLEALRDVENALINIKLQAEEAISLQNSVKASSETTEISEIRYHHGLVNYLDVTESERSELETKRALIDLLGWRYVSTIQLIRALGGSWETETDPCEED